MGVVRIVDEDGCSHAPEIRNVRFRGVRLQPDCEVRLYIDRLETGAMVLRPFFTSPEATLESEGDNCLPLGRIPNGFIAVSTLMDPDLSVGLEGAVLFACAHLLVEEMQVTVERSETRDDVVYLTMQHGVFASTATFAFDDGLKEYLEPTEFPQEDEDEDEGEEDD